jgi:hypothetical protein
LRRPRGNEYRGPADLRCRGFTPGPNLEPRAKAGYLTSRFNARFTWGAVHAPSPRAIGISSAWSPAAICLNDVAPSACSSAIAGAISAALADARCWRAAADCMRIFTVGLTPRLPPSFVPRLGGGERHARAGADPESVVFCHQGHDANDEVDGVRHVGGNEVDPTSAPQPWLSVAG